MFEASVNEFPFVAALPKREKSKMAKLWDSFREVKAITDEKGMLLPQKFAADLIGVSRQRVQELVEDGRLERVDLRGHPFITEKSMIAFAQSERKNGRPVKLPSNKEIFQSAFDTVARGKESAK